MGHAGFGGATFVGRAGFDSATFFGRASFYSVGVSRDASFNGATFYGDATFYNATFSGDAGFDTTTFSGDARFDTTAFFGNANFDGTAIAGYASFDSANVSGDASFHSASFAGHVSFHSATFSRNADFDSATFSDDASFGATFSGDARFDGATFSGNTSFDGAIFCGNASFDGGECTSRASFRFARFLAPTQLGPAKPTRFRGWRFNGVAEFDGARFERRVEFTASVFARLASFQGITWPERSTDAQGLFSQAVFKDLASFQGAGLRCFAAFDGAVLQGGLQLDDADERTANATFQREREEAERSSDREAALRHLEGGCRVLKQAMEKSANKAREQMFYAFELMARRHQHATPWWERQISRAYGAVADYGRSIGRPLLWLALLIPVFAAAYAGLLYGWRSGALAGLTPRVVLTECLSHSLQRVLPFGPWALTPAQIAGSPVQSLLNGPTDALFSLAIRTLGSLQSLLALTFAFLAGLAIRRRFQIN